MKHTLPEKRKRKDHGGIQGGPLAPGANKEATPAHDNKAWGARAKAPGTAPANAADNTRPAQPLR